MLKVLIIILLVIAFALNPIFRYTVTHLPQVSFNAFCDLRKYIKYDLWKVFNNFGRMNIYIADDSKPFGSGKTLNAVNDTIKVYKQYNDKEVYNFTEDCWVKQYVHIISNVTLYDVPFVKLESTQQITDIINMDSDINSHIYIILIDELGRIFNNRDWKTNLPSDLLGAILQQRKSKVVINGTVQDFSLFDATLRKVSSVVYVCSKTWRYLVKKKYSANEIERSGFNFSYLKPSFTSCDFATDKLYNSYDTNEVVSDLQKNVSSGKHFTNIEVLQNSVMQLPFDPKRKIKNKKRGA